MTLRDKIIAGITAAGLAAGATVIGLDQACVFDVEILEVADVKICFKTAADYKKYKDDRIALYKVNSPMFLWTEDGIEFMAMLNHEMKKKKIKIPNFDKTKNIVDEIVKQIK